MILYHGTTEVIKHPDISFSKDYLDFGKGFYLTSFQKQAEKWAMRKALRKRRTAEEEKRSMKNMILSLGQ